MKKKSLLIFMALSAAGLYPAALFCITVGRPIGGHWNGEIEVQKVYLDADPSPLAAALESLGVPYVPSGKMPLLEGRASVKSPVGRTGVLAADGGWQGGFADENVDLQVQWVGFFFEVNKPYKRAEVGAGLAGMYGWSRFETVGTAGVDRFKGKGIGGSSYVTLAIPAKGRLQLTGRSGWLYFKPSGSWDGLRVRSTGLADTQYDLGGLFMQWGLRYRF